MQELSSDRVHAALASCLERRGQPTFIGQSRYRVSRLVSTTGDYPPGRTPWRHVCATASISRTIRATVAGVCGGRKPQGTFRIWTPRIDEHSVNGESTVKSQRRLDRATPVLVSLTVKSFHIPSLRRVRFSIGIARCRKRQDKNPARRFPTLHR